MRYYITLNFAKSGMVGIFRIRSIIEAAVEILIAFILIKILPFAFAARVGVGLVVALPLALVSFYGIEGCTLSDLAVNAAKFAVSQKKYGTPSHYEISVREKSIIKKKKKQLDTLHREELLQAEAAALAMEEGTPVTKSALRKRKKEQGRMVKEARKMDRAKLKQARKNAKSYKRGKKGDAGLVKGGSDE